MNIYVGNLSYNAEENDLLEAFQQFGSVDTVKIIHDRETGRSRGFGFVEMGDDTEANEAISSLDQTDLMGRTLIVKQARERERKPYPRY